MLPPVRRTAGGMRDYGEKDCSWTTRSGVMRMRWKGTAYDHTK